jgi:hypothetical protein
LQWCNGQAQETLALDGLFAGRGERDCRFGQISEIIDHERAIEFVIIHDENLERRLL